MHAWRAALVLQLCFVGACTSVTSREVHGKFSLVTYSWTEWGACPKNRSQKDLHGPDGSVLLKDVFLLKDSPGGQWTLVQSPGKIFVIDQSKDSLLGVVEQGLLQNPEWSPVGDRLVMIRFKSLERDGSRGEAQHLVQIDLRERKPVCSSIFTGRRRSIERVTWSADGGSIAFFDIDYQRMTLVEIVMDPSPSERELTTVEGYDSALRIGWSEGRPLLFR